MRDILYLVVPCYNESGILNDSVSRLRSELAELIREFDLSGESRILLVDDGSTDNTWELIRENSERNCSVAGLRLARNVGHQNALLAGLMHARERADAVISLDADLQDDIRVLPDFLREFRAGNDIVYGVRSDRSCDSFFKRNSALAYYRLLELLGCRVVYNHADYRLMSKRALNELSRYHEVNLYLRGLMPLIGFRQSIVFYKRLPASRPTHYPLLKMLFLAWDGVTSFSVRPIRLITLAGFFMFAFSVVMLVYYALVRVFGHTVPGWTSQIFVSLLLGGVQLFCTGVVGEYIGKIYTEVKSRPRFAEDCFLPGKKPTGENQ